LVGWASTQEKRKFFPRSGKEICEGWEVPSYPLWKGEKITERLALPGMNKKGVGGVGTIQGGEVGKANRGKTAGVSKEDSRG